MDTSKNKSEAFRENAEALRAAKEWMMAYKWYDRLIRQYPDDAKALDYFYAGVSAYYGRDYNAAAKAYEAMETKFPDQPSATYWRGRTAAAIDNEAKEGTAVPFYTKWLELNIQGYERKPNDLMQAYQYLAVYYYNKNDKANTEKYLNLIQGLEPNNALIKQIRDAMGKKKS
jgi:tetratricopeptide (TPR) repeat protein